MLVAVKKAGVEEHQKRQQQEEMKPLQVGESVESDRERRGKKQKEEERNQGEVLSPELPHCLSRLSPPPLTFTV